LRIIVGAATKQNLKKRNIVLRSIKSRELPLKKRVAGGGSAFIVAIESVEKLVDSRKAMKKQEPHYTQSLEETDKTNAANAGIEGSVVIEN
jgi:hypothetical protein